MWTLEHDLPGSAPQLLADVFRMNAGRPIRSAHPDVEALLLLTVVWPWLDGHVLMPRPVSPDFAAAAAVHGVTVRPVDTRVPRRRPGARLGIGASGGVDSVAAAELVGRHHPHVHLRHVDHPAVENQAGHQEHGAIEDAVRVICADQRPLEVVTTDLGYLGRARPMFPTWAAVAAPLLLLADDLDLGGIVLGSVLGARFLTNGDRFRENPAHPWWFQLFEVVGLPFVRPTTALTEISTPLIADRTPIAGATRSCFRLVDGDCGLCPKCLRKDLVRAGLAGEPFARSEELEASAEIRKYFARQSIPMSHVWTWVLRTVPGLASSTLGELLVHGARGDRRTDWVPYVFSEGLEREVPALWRGDVARALSRFGLRHMTADHVRSLRQW
jgi:hypothetical protein